MKNLVLELRRALVVELLALILKIIPKSDYRVLAAIANVAAAMGPERPGIS